MATAKLARDGAKPVAKVTEDLGISESGLRNWVAQAKLLMKAVIGARTTWNGQCGRRSMYLGPCRRALTSGTSGGGSIGVVAVRLGIRQL